MSLLLDTHLAVWWHVNHPRLNGRARAVVESELGDVWLSRGSLWEVAIKVSSGKLPISPNDFANQMADFGFRWLDIRNTHLLEVATMPFEGHRDPFDRLLVAQARMESLTLLTADHRLARYGDFVRVV